jgi:AhpD family alkylhydroperoxidase
MPRAKGLRFAATIGDTVHPRIDYAKTAPGALTAMSGLETYMHQSGLERPLLELVKLRASFMNGCAYCVDMHTKVARSLGETEQRLYAVSLWRECPYYSERERAALAWTEAITLVSADHVPDVAYELVRPHFTEKELVDLTLAIVAINGWNRLAIAFRTVPGTFQLGGRQRDKDTSQSPPAHASIE